MNPNYFLYLTQSPCRRVVVQIYAIFRLPPVPTGLFIPVFFFPSPFVTRQGTKVPFHLFPPVPLKSTGLLLPEGHHRPNFRGFNCFLACIFLSSFSCFTTKLQPTPSKTTPCICFLCTTPKYLGPLPLPIKSSLTQTLKGFFSTGGFACDCRGPSCCKTR